MKQTETPQIDKRYKQTPHAVGWAGPPWFVPAIGVLTVCVLQKPRLPPGEGCSSESKKFSVYKWHPKRCWCPNWSGTILACGNTWRIEIYNGDWKIKVPNTLESQLDLTAQLMMLGVGSLVWYKCQWEVSALSLWGLEFIHCYASMKTECGFLVLV